MAEQKTIRREWLIAAREKKELSINQAAFALKISPTLLTWLERGADTITHPGIAHRIRKFYKLTVEQRNDLVAEKHAISEKSGKSGKKRASYDLVNGVKQ